MSRSRTAPARRRGTTISTAVIALLALVLTAFALRHPGQESSQIEVSDGGVWVSHRGDGMIGRMNVDAGELDARLSIVGDELEILQSGYTVMTVGGRGYTMINTASIVRGGTIELPPETEVALGGDRIAIAAPDGRVWILTPEQAAAFTTSAVEPVHTTDGGAPQIAVTDAGTVLVLDGDQLLRFPRTLDTSSPRQEDPLTVGGLTGAGDEVALSAVGEEPVVLDREKRQLRLGTRLRAVDLTEAGVSDAAGIELQAPGPESDRLAVATEDALLEVPLGRGEIVEHPAGGTGTPAVPVRAGSCAYGAWNGSLRYARICDGAEPVLEAVPEADAGAELVLRENHDLVVLDDASGSASWTIQKDMALVDDWVITQDIQQDEKEVEEETVTTTITDVEEERDQENRPPVANDDEHGVRPGANVVLPVTRNDTDPDGDVLLADVKGAQPEAGTVTPIRGGTQLQVAVAEDASGTSTFTYEVSDGRGGTDTATVTLTVHAPGENTAPEPADQAITRVQVLSGESVTLNVLPYWEDPEGDAFYLADAAIAPEDLVTFRPDGTVTVDDAGLVTGPKQVALTFRDEHGAASEHVLEVEAVTDPELAPITTTDHLRVVTGRTGTVKPLVNDINPAGGQLELTHVEEVEGLEIEADPVTGTVRASGEVGTYYLQYTASATSASSTGLLRIDVVDPAEESLLPVPVDDMALATTGGDVLVDPLENDVDPTGGVLVLGSVQVPDGSGLKATVVGHHLLRVEASPDAEVGEEPIPLSYEVANSAGSTTGTVRVMLARTDTQFANPVGARDDGIVRAGDMVMLDVLDNDLSPTGSDLSLGEITDTAGLEGLGQVERHDQQIRFTADPSARGEATFTYEVLDATGRSGAARVTVRIVPADAPNTAPRPESLTARAVAGTSVRIPVPTSGIDPDGDSVMLMGASEPAPELGRIVSAHGTWIEYLPDEGAVGTDRFRYQVMDPSGAVGTAEVLVGVAAPTDRNQPPYAVDDQVDVRPEREIEVPVLENDSDPESDELSLVPDSIEPTTDIEVLPPDEHRSAQRITAVAPAEPGTHTILHRITDGQLASAATLTVRVDPNAPLLEPIATDDHVDPADVLDPDRGPIRVDLLANDRDPDGSVADLEVSLDTAAEGASLDGRILTLTPAEEQQRLRYTITDLDGQTSSGYVWVPGTSRIAPVWAGEPLEVVAGGEKSIDLADPANVRVRPGADGARIVDPSTVTAGHTDGTDLVVDETTLLYRPAADFVGRDTISLEVSDGPAGDATAATGTMSIPVQVLPGDTNLPPTLRGSVLEVEVGGSATTVDLATAAEDPDGDPLDFALGEAELPEGVTAEIVDGRLAVTASADATLGASAEQPITVTDGETEPVDASFQVIVVGSTRPLATAVMDVVEIDAGRTEELPVLENDSNPFPGEPLELVSAQLTNGSGSVDVAGDRVVLTPDADFAGVLSASYTVEDRTGDPARRAVGEIRATVRGKPEAPSAPRIGEVGDGSVELVFTAGDDNGAPITGYTVTSASGPAVSQECASTSCTLTGLANGTEYRFQVVATNDVGDSPASAPSAVARPDVRPEAPAAPSVTRGDGQLGVSWSAPENRGSALQSYELEMQAGGQTQSRTVEAATTELVWEGLANGTDHRFRVRASNLAEEPSEWSGWSSPEHPAGPPKALDGKVTAERTNDRLGGGVRVSWPAASDAVANGEPITSYLITGTGGVSASVDGGTTSHVLRGLDPDTSYSFTITAENSVGRGPASAASNTVVPWAVPEAPTGVKASLPDAATGTGPNGRATVSWSPAAGNGTAVKDYVVRWSGGSRTVPAGTTSVTVDGLANGTAYRFTVQARNRFEGGESALSTASNSVTPYTVPDPPRLSADNSGFICHSLDDCRIKLDAMAPADAGGTGFKHLVLSPQGFTCNRLTKTGDGSSTCDVAPETTYTVTAYAENDKGLRSATTTYRFTTPPMWNDTSLPPIELDVVATSTGTESYRVTPKAGAFKAVDYEWRTYASYEWRSAGGTGPFEISTDRPEGDKFYVRGVDADGNYSQFVTIGG